MNFLVKLLERLHTWLGRPAGRLATVAFGLLLCLAPAVLFADLLAVYRLHSDDFPYIAGSRTFSRAVANLFAPHNTHIVPAWRVLTWGLVACAGRLSRIPPVFAVASYGILAATMLLGGRLVKRETGHSTVALLAIAALGTTSLMRPAATWYSAGQTLWAGYAILTMLWYLQGWRRQGRAWRLVLVCVSAAIAGGFWAVGHVAGPVGAVYLWSDGRSRCRRAAIVPLLASIVTVAVFLGLGGRRIDATISFHGRTAKQAFDLRSGVTHTLQAIPEDLVLGNLGLLAQTTPAQGAVFSCAIFAAWVWSMKGRRPLPIEVAGGFLVISSYVFEWSFRGYLEFTYLRRVVPWYDTIPQIGAVLFAAGWWARSRYADRAPTPAARGGALAAFALAVALIVLNQPSVADEFLDSVPKMRPFEAEFFKTKELQHVRAVYLDEQIATWQRRHLARLDEVETLAKSLGIGRELVRTRLGRLAAPELPEVYDAADLVEWAEPANPAASADSLRGLLAVEPEPALTPERLRGILRGD